MIDSFDGIVWRHVPAGAHPLHAGWILRASGRWNRPGRYGCLYTATSRGGAVAEWQRYVERAGPGTDRRPRDVVSIVVRVRPVADFTDHTFCRRFGVTLAQLTGDADADWEACRTLADVLRAERYRALHAPSAALTGTANLIIYLEGAADDLLLNEGGDRTALNYGPDPLASRSG